MEVLLGIRMEDYGRHLTLNQSSFSSPHITSITFLNQFPNSVLGVGECFDPLAAQVCASSNQSSHALGAAFDPTNALAFDPTSHLTMPAAPKASLHLLAT